MEKPAGSFLLRTCCTSPCNDAGIIPVENNPVYYTPTHSPSDGDDNNDEINYTDDAATPPGGRSSRSSSPSLKSEVTRRLLRSLTESEAQATSLIAAARLQRDTLRRQAEEQAQREVQLYREHFAIEFKRLEERHATESERCASNVSARTASSMRHEIRRASRHSAEVVAFLIEKVCEVNLDLESRVATQLRRCAPSSAQSPSPLSHGQQQHKAVERLKKSNYYPGARPLN